MKLVRLDFPSSRRALEAREHLVYYGLRARRSRSSVLVEDPDDRALAELPCRPDRISMVVGDARRRWINDRTSPRSVCCTATIGIDERGLFYCKSCFGGVDFQGQVL